MSHITRWMDAKLYPQFGDRWDDKAFRVFIKEFLDPDDDLLDLGAGRGRVMEMKFKGQVSRVCGIDLDPAVMENPLLDEAKISSCESISYPDESFDCVVSDNVLEHLERPKEVFDEVRRVLKPGGVFLAKTPNFKHYMPLIAHITPHKFHVLVNRLRGRAETDTFPTYYRANTPFRIRQLAKDTDLNVREIQLLEGRPEYLRFSFLTYLAGFLYERLVRRWGGCSQFRAVLMMALQKK